MTWKPDICVYHGGCDDGFAAAWVVRNRWPDVRFVYGSYTGTSWPEDIAEKNILFVDFSLKRQQMMELANGGITGAVPASIVVLDHHKTAEAELAQWNIGPVHEFSGARIGEHIAQAVMEQAYPIVAHFDMDHSGARMAWDFCRPSPNDAVPMLIELIEDRDLWRFKYSTTRTVSAALRTYPHDFDVWDRLDIDTLRDEGRAILRGHEKNIGEFCKHAYMMDIGGHTVPVVNVPYHYASDTANALLSRFPDAQFAACWFQVSSDHRQFSLRSSDDRVDVSEVAKAFGGGGHRNAAGFTIATPTPGTAGEGGEG